MTTMTDADRAEELRRYAADGFSATIIARLLGVHLTTVLARARRFDIVLPSHADACRESWRRPDTLAVRRAASVKAAETRKVMLAARAAMPKPDAPPEWVPAELREDFRDFARLYGPERAARELKAMIREMELS